MTKRRVTVPGDAGWKEVADEAARLYVGNDDVADAIERWTKTNPIFFEKLKKDGFRRLFRYLAESARHRTSRSVRRGALVGVCKKGEETMPKRDLKASAKFLARMDYSRWLDGFEVAGKKLRNCTRIDLREDAEHQRSQAGGCLSKAVFEETLSKQIGGDRIMIGDTKFGKFTDEQFAEMYATAEEKAGKLAGV